MRADSALFDETLATTVFTGVVLLTFVGALGFFAGGLGVLGGLLVAGVWYLFGTPTAIALGTVCVGVLVPGEGGLGLPAVTLTPLAALLFVPAIASSDPLRYGGITGISLVACGGAGVLLIALLPLWVAGVAILTGLALGSYLLHRLLLLRLGLLSDENAPTSNVTVTDNPR